jgi:hypothetical protein
MVSLLIFYYNKRTIAVIGGEIMSQCSINHSAEDVQKKYEAQKEFLPSELLDLFNTFFTKTHTQETLNVVFHLLKKYDLSDEDEKQSRNEKLLLVLK